MTADPTALPPPALLPPADRSMPLWQTIVMWVLIAGIALSSLGAGVKLREWFFDTTEDIHFIGDNRRNHSWGFWTFYNMHDRGRSFLDTYDDVGIQDRTSHLYTDYAPARLAVYTAWIGSNHETNPYSQFRSDREYWSFFVRFNTVMEAIAAVGAFLLTAAVVRRSGRSVLRANTLGLIAFLLMWFSPAMIISAHGWPSGDMWVVPPFIWATYFAVKNRWVAAGAVLAIGTLFKGQVLFVTPMFLLWPIFQGRIAAPLLLACGLLGTFGLLTSGWTLTHVDADRMRHLDWRAVSYAILLPSAVLALTLSRRFLIPLVTDDDWRVRALLATALGLFIAILLFWPLRALEPSIDPTQHVADLLNRRLIFAIALGVGATIFLRSWWRIAAAAFGFAGLAMLMSMRFFDTCYAWFDASYMFGTQHFNYMVMGMTSNLPGIMAKRFGWDMNNSLQYVIFTIGEGPRATDVTLKMFHFSIYLLLLVVCALGVSMHDRRRDTRFLVAIVTPWILFFTIPLQIHERYLLFAGAAACVCIGHSIGTTLLGLFMSVLTFLMTIHVMLLNAHRRQAWGRYLHETYPAWFDANTPFPDQLLRFINGTHPDIGWAVMLTALIFLWMTITPGKRGKVVSGVW